MRTYNVKALSTPFPQIGYGDIHISPIPQQPTLTTEQQAQQNIQNYASDPSDPLCPTPNTTTFTASLSEWNLEIRAWNRLTAETWDKIFYNIAYGCCNCSCLPSIPSGYMADSISNCTNEPWRYIPWQDTSP